MQDKRLHKDAHYRVAYPQRVDTRAVGVGIRKMDTRQAAGQGNHLVAVNIREVVAADSLRHIVAVEEELYTVVEDSQPS